MRFLSFLLGAAVSVSTVSAHFAVTYPYWRGDSYATQWTYPCGGVNQSVSDSNRTAWPLDGGSLVFTPTHDNAQTYVNLGVGNNVTRLNVTLVPPFNQTGNGTFCFPKISIPSGLGIGEGTNASIQVIQLSHNGGALYNCADITFRKDAPGPPTGMCVNSTGVGAEPLGSDDDVAPKSSSQGDQGSQGNQGNSSSSGDTSKKSGASKTTVGMLSAAGLFVAGLALF